MRFEWYIARRYLFGKKRASTINIITGLSMFGIAIGAAALFLVLSVFNGFEDLLGSMVSRFNPDIKIVPSEGKYIEVTDSLLYTIKSVDGVREVSETLEEVALFRYEENLQFGIIKGVDSLFNKVNSIDSAILDGYYLIGRGKEIGSVGVFGAGVANSLKLALGAKVTQPVAVYMPKKKKRGALDRPFRTQFLIPSGVFSIQQEIDMQYVLAPLPFVERLLNVTKKRSAIEVDIDPEVDPVQVSSVLSGKLGTAYDIRDRRKQDEAYYKLMKLEKWMFFALFALMMLLVAFNIIGALWMIVLSKQQDIAILKAMGATAKTVRNIFLFEGLLISIYGLISGLILGMVLYLLQKHVGLVGIPEGFVIDSYPLSFRWTDWIVVGVTVLSIGMAASVLPSLRAMRISVTKREK